MVGALGRNAPGSLRLLMLYMLDRRARRADQLRRECLRIQTNTIPET